MVVPSRPGPGATSPATLVEPLGGCGTADVMLDSMSAFRLRHPAGSFHNWLQQLTAEDIANLVMRSAYGTGIWRRSWDSLPLRGQVQGPG